MKKYIVISDPFPRTLDLIFSKKKLDVIATSPVFAKPVAEIALGMTLSILRNIHNAPVSYTHLTLPTILLV